MMGYMCEAATKAHSSLPYGMVLTFIFKDFRVPISNEEPKRLLRYTDHYNLQTLHHIGYKKENDKWVRKEESRRTKGVDNTKLESSHTRPISPTQPHETSTSTDDSQLSDDQLRKNARLVAKELRGQVIQDNSTLVQLVESIKEEFSKFTQQF